MNERIYTNLEAKVERILFFNGGSKWGVLSVTNPFDNNPYFKEDTLIVTGNFDGVYQGCTITFDGYYTVHPRYGAQIALNKLVVEADTTNKESVINFLAKSHIKGIDVRNASKIWAMYKENSVSVVLNHPEELLQIKGIGEATYAKILSSVAQYKRMEELIKFCNEVGIPYNITYKLDQVLGEAALPVIKSNIYKVLEVSELIPFSSIDAIALKMGMDPLDDRRTRACLEYCLRNKIMLNSSTGCVNAELKEDFYKKIGVVDVGVYNAVLNRLVKEEVITLEGANVFLKYFYEKEKFISFAIANLLQTPVDNSSIQPETIDNAIISFPFELNQQQIEAIKGIINSRVSVLTGGPGSGKSTITKAIVDIYTKSRFSVYCLSPTGKATRRMTECTGYPASTVHKFLGCRGQSLDQLEVPIVPKDSVIIIDESSMLDISMLSKILEIANTTPIRLVLVGDKDQLPSVMAGNILSDLINSGFSGVFKLTDIMRQAKDSHIIKYCADVNAGKVIPLCTYTDFVYNEYSDEDDLRNDLMENYEAEVARHGLMEVQVITAYKKGALGTINLNKDIASWCNPNPVNESFGFRFNDKIMQITNDYEKNVFNGEVGICGEFTHDEMSVKFQSGNDVSYYTEELSSLMLAYASTCHKSQGAEYSVVFVILDNTNGNFLLTRKLLYTAMSRGKKKVYVYSKTGCVGSCIRNVFESPRITKLKDFLENHLNLPHKQSSLPGVTSADIEEIPF